MKRKMSINGLMAAALTAALTVVTASAATVIPAYNNSTGGLDPAFFYGAKVTMTTTDSWSAGTVDLFGWSYRDLDVASNQNAGWGHAANWYLFELGADAYFTVNLTSTDPLAQPGFTIYGGETIVDRPVNAHTFSNNGNDLVLLNDNWDDNGPAGAPGLVYKGHGFSGQTASLSGTFFLPAGLYTVALGNAADSNNAPASVSYNASFTTVPEPSTLAVLALGAFSAFGRRRRLN